MGYWLVLVTLFCGSFGGIKGLLLGITKVEPLFLEISSTFIWTCRITFCMFVLLIAINH